MYLVCLHFHDLPILCGHRGDLGEAEVVFVLRLGTTS
jgi:hypothetical protein